MSQRNELTAREEEISKLIIAGMSNPEIGRALGIATGTVKIHTKNIFDKLGINERGHIAAALEAR